MPPPLDLTGQRFGNLIVIRSDGRVFWGQDQAAWMCRCDCGADVRVPQKRLTTKRTAHQLHACEDCRATPCEICGKPVLRIAKSKTCSPECKAERHRRYQLSYYHNVRSADPLDTQKRRARQRDSWAALTPEEKRAVVKQRKESEGADRINERARERHAARMASDPEYAARKRAARQKYLAADPERAREYDRRAAAKKRARLAELGTLRAIEALREKSDDE